MPIDPAKFGESVARVLDRLEKMIEKGEINGEEWELDEVLVVAGFTKPLRPDDEIYADEVEILVLVDGTTQIPYVQHGLLRFAGDVVFRSSGD